MTIQFQVSCDLKACAYCAAVRIIRERRLTNEFGGKGQKINSCKDCFTAMQKRLNAFYKCKEWE